MPPTHELLPQDRYGPVGPAPLLAALYHLAVLVSLASAFASLPSPHTTAESGWLCWHALAGMGVFFLVFLRLTLPLFLPQGDESAAWQETHWLAWITQGAKTVFHLLALLTPLLGLALANVESLPVRLSGMALSPLIPPKWNYLSFSLYDFHEVAAWTLAGTALLYLALLTWRAFTLRGSLRRFRGHETMEKHIFPSSPRTMTALAPSATALEPTGLVQYFLAHPPLGFTPILTPQGIPAFLAPFDYLLTADEALVRCIERLPGGRKLRHLLVRDTCFVGSTVSEYCPLPPGADVTQLPAALRAFWDGRTQLLIVKDIPVDSPLLSAQANRQAATFLQACREEGFLVVDGQALAYVPIDFADEADYLARLSSGRRRDLRRKLRARDKLRLEIEPTGSARFDDEAFVRRLYAQYRAVYEQSTLHFDLLSPEFFAAVLRDGRLEGRVFLYFHEEALVGYNLCFIWRDLLVDKYIGFDYAASRAFNLYFVSWFENLAFARREGLRHYVAGWTDPEIKAYLGAQFTFTRHAIAVRSPLLRLLLRRLAPLFENDRRWFDAHAADTDRP